MEANKMSVAKPEIRLIRLKEFKRCKNCQTLIEPRMWNGLCKTKGIWPMKILS